MADIGDFSARLLYSSKTAEALIDAAEWVVLLQHESFIFSKVLGRV